MKREQSYYYDWTNEDHFNLMNMSDKPSFTNPGFKELGVKAHCPLPTIHESCVSYLVIIAYFGYLGISFIIKMNMFIYAKCDH